METAKTNKDVTIIIATHKKYQMPQDSMYLPVHVGAAGKDIELGYIKDNTGENISEKNASYCELTGLYWAWRNLDSAYIGLAHYRRHFSYSKKSQNAFENVLKYSELNPLLKKYKVFVPKKRNYYIETLYSHYAHTHYASHLDEARKIIKKMYPQYLKNFDIVMNRCWGYMFNMMIMQKNLFADYCEWLFNILFALEKKIGKKNENLSGFQGRFYGRVSEILFNVWLEQKLTEGTVKDTEIKELNFVYMEKIDWKRKGVSFLKAKFGHKKYERSF